METASSVLETIPQDQKNKVARFLEGQGYKELALEVATDPEHRFDLALSLNKLNVALEMARVADVEHKWKIVGDAALTAWDLQLAEECFEHAKDLGSLLLLHSSSANRDGLRRLAEQADAAGANNIAFSCFWQLADADACIDLLVRTKRVAEAVLFAQTYKPSRTGKLVTQWKGALDKEGKGKVARTIGVPPGEEDADEELFPEWESYLKLEQASEKHVSLVDVSEPADDQVADGDDDDDDDDDDVPATMVPSVAQVKATA